MHFYCGLGVNSAWLRWLYVCSFHNTSISQFQRQLPRQTSTAIFHGIYSNSKFHYVLTASVVRSKKDQHQIRLVVFEPRWGNNIVLIRYYWLYCMLWVTVNQQEDYTLVFFFSLNSTSLIIMRRLRIISRAWHPVIPISIKFSATTGPSATGQPPWLRRHW